MLNLLYIIDDAKLNGVKHVYLVKNDGNWRNCFGRQSGECLSSVGHQAPRHALAPENESFINGPAPLTTGSK